MRGINSTEQELMGYISEHKIINTHSHHLPEQKMMDFDLDKLFRQFLFAMAADHSRYDS